MLGVFHGSDVRVVEGVLGRLEGDENAWVPEVSTMVVVRALLLLRSGGMVMTGTTVWILYMKVSFTNDVTRLSDVQHWAMRRKGTLTCLRPAK